MASGARLARCARGTLTHIKINLLGELQQYINMRLDRSPAGTHRNGKFHNLTCEVATNLLGTDTHQRALRGFKLLVTCIQLLGSTTVRGSRYP
jgi:hypothetical protein